MNNSKEINLKTVLFIVFGFATVGFAYLLTVSFVSFGDDNYDAEAPNILLIMADDLGYEAIGINGGASYQTPNIDRMAREGIRFEHCYAQPLCTPSRVQIMTGIYNVRNYRHFGLLDTSQTTFAHLFQDAGYATCVVGKWQLGKDTRSPYWAGFDEYCLWQVTTGRMDSTGRDTRFSAPELEINSKLRRFKKDEYGPDLVSDYGLEFMKRCVEQDQPFLLYYPMILTHCPFSPTPQSAEWESDDTTVLSYKGQPHYFEDMVSYTDELIGRLMEKLVDLGIDDQTLVIFTGDNGTDVPIVSQWNERQVAGAKGRSTDAGTRVPLIARWPEVITPGTESSALVDFTDILPTICAAADITLETEMAIDGHSILPLLTGNGSSGRDWVYSWYSRGGEIEKARIFARDQTYKLYQTGELYDVPNDPLELNPLDTAALSDDARSAYDTLSKVLAHYKDRRYDAL